MTSQDDWPIDGGHSASDPMDDLIGPPQKSGMSPWLKVMLVIFFVFGLVCCGCCGGMWYWFSQQEINMEDPDGARAVAQEVLKQPVPEEMFEPKGSMNFSFFSFFEMKLGLFEARDGEGLLMLMKMAVPQQPGQEDQFEQALRGQSAQNSKQLVIESTETKTLDVKGIGEVEFQFSKGKEPETGQVYHQIQGVFPSAGGGTLFLLQMEPSIYDEAAIVQWLTGKPVADSADDDPEPQQAPGESDADKSDADTDDANTDDADTDDAKQDDAATDDAGKDAAGKGAGKGAGDESQGGDDQVDQRKPDAA